MTVIVAVTDGTRVCVAADSQCTAGNGVKLTLAGGKVSRVPTPAGLLLIAAEGSLATDHFIRHHPIAVNCGPDATLDYLAARFAEELRTHLMARDLMRLCDGTRELPGNILMARGCEFVLIDSGGSVVRVESDWWAIGSGAPEARGAMWLGMQAGHVDHEQVARMAVHAAIELDSGCGFPIRVEWTEP